MPEPETLTYLSRKEWIERQFRLTRGYMAFIAALLLILLANREQWALAWLPGTLFALSLPSLAAFELIDQMAAAVRLESVSRLQRWAMALGFGPSLLGLCLVVGHMRWFAGVLLGLLIVFWVVAIIWDVYLPSNAREQKRI